MFRILEHDANGVSLTNYRAFAGDATGDGAFDTQDLVAVFQFGAYEDGENGNADWLSGDWDHDGVSCCSYKAASGAACGVKNRTRAIYTSCALATI